MTTINGIATIDNICHNNIKVSYMERDCGYQIYFINYKGKDLEYTGLNEFNHQINKAINKNKTFYLTFCGVSKNGNNIPDYYYITLTGKQVSYKNNEFKFDINANLEKILNNIFKENIGVFIQIYL